MDIANINQRAAVCLRYINALHLLKLRFAWHMLSLPICHATEYALRLVPYEERGNKADASAPMGQASAFYRCFLISAQFQNGQCDLTVPPFGRAGVGKGKLCCSGCI